MGVVLKAVINELVGGSKWPIDKLKCCCVLLGKSAQFCYGPLRLEPFNTVPS